MASRALARVATRAADYERVYDRLLRQARQPVVLHWLGDMFDPALKGYWGSSDLDRAMETALAVIKANPSKVDGIKISLLDKDKEIEMRRRLPAGVRMYTGDDFNYAELIAGDGAGELPTHRQSDALLGIFDAIAPAASAALAELAAGNTAKFHEILGPTVPLSLSRHIFRAPTRFYKTGVVFMAWLNGYQDHFVMVGGQQSSRSLPHFAELLRLADAAGLIEQPEVAAYGDGPCAVETRSHHRRMRATRYQGDFAVARSGRRNRAGQDRAPGARKRPGIVGLLPRGHVPGFDRAG
jgi:hypothetical protein